MRRLVPHPILTLMLTLVWMLLTRFSPGHLILGTVVALAAGLAMAAVEPDRPKLRRLHLVPGFVLRVAWEVLLSNIAVARLILTGAEGRSGFIEISLDLRDRNALAVLAVIITATPGTAWVDFDRSHNTLLLHVLDLGDTDWPALIKHHFERPLMEIFG